MGTLGRAVFGIAVFGAACTPTPLAEGPPVGGPPAPASSPRQTPASASAALPSTRATTPPAIASATPSSAPLDLCRSDDDCVVDFTTTSGPFICCSGCVSRAITKAALEVFRAQCAQQPPQQCPPLGCASALAHGACEQRRCVLRPGEKTRSGD